MNYDDPRYNDAYRANLATMREQVRASTALAIGKAYNRRDLSDQAIVRGWPIEHLEREILQEIAEPQRPLGVIGMTRSEIQQWSLFRWLMDPEVNSESLERECSRAVGKALGIEDRTGPGHLLVPLEIQQRDLNAAVGGAGGFFIGQHVASFSAALQRRSVAYSLGALRLTGLRGDTHVPRIATSATSTWLSNETTQAAESTQVFQDVAMKPKTVGVYCELARNVVKQSAPTSPVEPVVMQDIGGVCAQAVDIGAIAGTGASGQMLGILNTPGVGTFTGTNLDLAALTNAQVDVSTANAVRNEAALGYAKTPAVAALLKARPRFAAGTSTALWEGSVHSGVVEGVRAVASTAVPDGTMIFGCWENLMIGEWGVLEIMSNPFANFQAGIIGIRALFTVDVGIAHLGGFSIATTIT